ncbi:MAG TPA: chemotaxis protein CheW [Pyrinomonadaceae bacterium]|nr:chemotaxis protein CheW [Pyrinomonadaceae bacterium]
MTDKTEFADISILPRTLGLADAEDERERRELLVARCGARLIGVFADEAGQVTAWKPLTPLPGAPQGVLGVVSLRGRISTVLDPLSLLGERRETEATTPFAFIITLRGDEQLALAVERAERIIEIFTDDVEPLGSSSNSSVVRGLLQTEGALVAVLNTRELFAAALLGTERRRKRGKE